MSSTNIIRKQSRPLSIDGVGDKMLNELLNDPVEFQRIMLALAPRGEVGDLNKTPP